MAASIHGRSRHELDETVHDLAPGLDQNLRLEHAVPVGRGCRRSREETATESVKRVIAGVMHVLGDPAA